MKFTKLLLASSISAALLSGCGSDSSSDGSSVSNPGFDPVKRTLSGELNQDITLTAGTPWQLNGIVTLGNGNGEIKNASKAQKIKSNGYTLTIEPGVNIEADADGVLVITRGSKIMAEGTRDKPITFSSEDDNFDGTGEWGGIIVQGFAPHHALGSNDLCSIAGTCNVQGEGGNGAGFFAGEDAADNSGVMTYVRIAEAGKVAGPNNEVNGLTLQGVGHGTKLEYIQVHGNLDDGIEWFGGTANLKYAVLTNNDDDDLDFDEGYQGHIQHVLIIKDQNKAYPTGSNDPRGIEANSSDNKSVKATHAKLANITIIGSDMVRTDNDNPAAGEKELREQPGMRLRGDVQVDMTNSLVDNYYNCIRIDNGRDENTRITFNNVITGDCQNEPLVLKATKADSGTGAIPSHAGTPTNIAQKISFDDALAGHSDHTSLSSGIDIDPIEGRTEFTFDKTDYIGAIDPNTDNTERNWWSGWTIPDSTDINDNLKAPK